MQPIGIDAGHGWTKGMTQDGTRTLFPSLICPAPATVDLGAFGSEAGLVGLNGQPYLVGEAARRHATPLWDREKATDRDTAALIMVAAAQLGVSGPLHLATGLPLSWYGPQRRAFKAALEGHIAQVTLPGQPTTRLWLESVLVLPQGVAAAGPILAQPLYDPGPYLIVDFGYRTTDYIIVTKQATGRLVFDPAAAGSLELGCHTMSTAVATQLTTQYQVPFQAAALESLEAVAVRGRRIDLGPIRQQAQKAVVRRVARALAEALDHQLDQVLGVVAVGGGSAWLADVLPAVIQPAEAQWANAAGYMASLMS